MRKSEFNKYINSLSQEELIDEISQLYNKLSDVKTYYKMELGSEKDRSKFYERIKKDITSKYATKSYRRPRRPRIQKINALLKVAEKKAVLKHELIDLYLFNAQSAIDFMMEYYFHSIPLENTIFNSIEKALDITQVSLMQDAYKERFENAFSVKPRIFKYPPLLQKKYYDLYKI